MSQNLQGQKVDEQQVTWLKALTNRLGPAGIVGMTIAGPGTISAVLKSASAWSYSMLWVVVMSAIFATVGMYMTIRVTAATGKDAVEVVKENIGKVYVAVLALIIVVVQFCVVLAQGNALALVGSNILNQSAGGLLPFNIPTWVLAVTLTAAVCVVYFFRGSFSFAANVAWFLLAFMIVCFGITMLIAKPSLGGIFRGLIPNYPPVFPGLLPIGEAAGVLGGILGGAFGLYTFIYHPFALKEKGWNNRESMKYAFWDNFWASGITYGVFGVTLFITFASVIYTTGKVPAGIGGAAVALEPLLGRFAYWVFLFGWFAAVFTTTAGASMIGFTPIAKVLGFNPTLKDKKFRTGMIIYCFVAAAIVGPFLGQDAINFLIWAMALLSLTAPIGVGTWLYLGNKKDIMGDLKFLPWLNAVGVVMLLSTLWIAYMVAKSMWFS